VKYSQKEIKRFGLSCLNMSLRRTSRLITTYYDFMLKPAGLRITQFTVLMSIAYEENQSITELARVTDIDRTTLQRSLEILKRDGLVLMEKKEIGNVSSLSLTKKGEMQLTKGIELWQKAQEAVMEKLGKSELKKIMKNLTAVRKIAILESGAD